MDTPWLSFIPYHLAEYLRGLPTDHPLDQSFRLNVVALFADVSGFTQMSEALSHSGRAGAEELTLILNSYFQPMIALIQDYGGIIGKFGGDAMTVLFPTSDQTRPAVVRRALQCAVEMQANMHRYEAIPTSVGRFSLAMKAGLALGQVLCTTVGLPGTRLEYIIAGSALDRCADAEHHASKGEVVIENSLLAYAGSVEIAAERGGYTCISGLKRRAAKRPLSPLPPENELLIQTIGEYLHPALAQRIQRGQSSFINEHRLVTVLFGRFTGFDYEGDPLVGERLQEYLAAVIQTIALYDGYLNKVDMGDKGSKFIILFGAPIGHEDDEERAMRCGLELLALPQANAHLGIHTGFVYCGLVGSKQRQEYTVMGDAVNLAARLMQAAGPGQILVSEQTWQRSGPVFAGDLLPPLPVKGKTEPILVRQLRGLKEDTAVSPIEPGHKLPLVGREDELNRAREAIQAVLQGRGRVVGVTAEAGVGKSRFSAAVTQLAMSQGLAVLAGAAQSYGKHIPYLLWRDIWRTFFGIQATASLAEQIGQLEAQLTVLDPRLLPRLPLLGSLLNLPIPDNALTKTLDGQLRADLTRSLALDCLRQRSQNTPLLLVLEDCHWLDDLSQELLAFIGHNLAHLPVLLLVNYRPPDDGRHPLHWAATTDPVTILNLPELNEAQVKRLAHFKLQQLQAGLSGELPTAVEQIISKAQGNPYYLEEMLNYIYEQTPDLADETALAALKMPDNLHNLIISRLDQLPEGEKTTLKVASVVGRTFPESWLWGSYPAVGEPETVRQHLQTLQQKDITLRQESQAEPTYLFKHITTQEVAYETLAFSTRTSLHESIGQFVEERYADSRGQYLDELAFHYGRSPNQEKQRTYFRLAGDAAKNSFANQAAIDYYARLLPLLPPAEQGAALLQLGQVWRLVGKWDEAEHLYQLALEMGENNHDLPLLADCQLDLGRLWLLAHPESAEEALNWLTQAQESYAKVADLPGVGRTLEELSFTHTQLGNYDLALACAEQQLQIARQHHDQIGESGAHDYLGLAYLHQGEHEKALHHLHKSVEIATTADYKKGIILACNNLAGVYWQLGDLHHSLLYLQRALETAEEIGYLEMVGACLENVASIYQFRGDYTAALAYHKYALTIASEIGDWSNIAIILDNMGVVFMARSQFKEAYRLIERAVELVRPMNSPHLLSEFLGHQAQLWYEMGRFAEATAVNQELLALAAQSGQEGGIVQATIRRLQLELALKKIEVPGCTAVLQQLLERMPDNEAQAAIHYEMWRLTQHDGARETAATLYRELHTQSPKVAYQERYRDLTGETLSPPPLPTINQAQSRLKEREMPALLSQVGVSMDETTIPDGLPEHGRA